MKRSASPTIRTRPAIRVFVAALTATLAALLFPYVPLVSPASAQESTQQMPAGMEAGKDGVSIGGGVYAGDGCARVGELEAGDCARDGARDNNGSGGSDEESQGNDESGPSDGRYGAEDGPGGGPGEATMLESTTSGDSGGGESTQSQTIESTTGVVEEGPDADDEVHPGAAGEPEPGGTTDEATTEGVAPEEGATGAEDADQTCASDGPMGETTTTTVEDAVDGDTVDTTEGTVRLIGVDTPETVDPGEPVEPVEPGGKEASAFTASELEGEEVRLEFGEEPRDDYGRALAYLWTEDGAGQPLMFNETLLREGLAELLVIPPNYEYERCLAAAKKGARAEGVGVWSETAPPETTGGVTAPETTPTDETPPADDEGGQDGILGGLLGGEEPSGSSEDQYEGETTAPKLEDSPAVGDQYEEIQEPEIQAPEVQQGPEERDSRNRDDELAGPTPTRPSVRTAAETPAPIPEIASTELPAAEGAEDPPSSVPAGTASITTLPETGGPTLPRLAAPLLGVILVGGGLFGASLARSGRDTKG